MRDEMGNPLLEQDALGKQHDDDLAAAQKEEQRKQEEEAQRAREREQRVEGDAPVVQQGQEGSGQSGQRTSGLSEGPVDDSFAQSLAGGRDDGTGELVVDMPVELKSLSKNEQKKAKKSRDAVVKIFNKLETAIRKNKDSSKKIDTFFDEISRCNFVNGRLPEELRALVVAKLKILQKSRVSEEVKEYTGMVIDALEVRSTSDSTILQGGAKQLREVSALSREASLPVRYDKSKPLSEQDIYKKAEELEAKLSKFTGMKYSGPVEETLNSLQEEYWKSKGITLRNGSFNPEDAPTILSKMAEDPTLLKDPLVADFIQKNLSKLFPSSRKITANYNYTGDDQYGNIVDEDSAHTINLPSDKSWKDLRLEDFPDSKEFDIVSGYSKLHDLTSSDPADQYSDMLISRFLRTSLTELSTSNRSTFTGSFKDIVKVQSELGSRIRRLLEGDTNQSVDTFISENKKYFDELKRLSPKDYPEALEHFKTMLAEIPAKKSEEPVPLEPTKE